MKVSSSLEFFFRNWREGYVEAIYILHDMFCEKGEQVSRFMLGNVPWKHPWG